MTTETTQTIERVTFTVPLPPRSLRDNASAHWGQRKKDADSYSMDVFASLHVHAGETWCRRFMKDNRTDRWPWARAHVTYVWKYASVAPDHSNLGRHTKYLQDIICMAPKLSPEVAAKYKRYHLGIIENDSGIEAKYKLEKVAHRRDECVELTIERVEG